MTSCTIPTFVNVFAENLFIRLEYMVGMVTVGISAYTPDENWQQSVARLQVFMEVNEVIDVSKK